MISLITLLLILEVLIKENKEAIVYFSNYDFNNSSSLFPFINYSSFIILNKIKEDIFFVNDKRSLINDCIFISFIIKDIKYCKTIEILFEGYNAIFIFDLLKEARLSKS